jgi:hypothetical protein
MDTSQMSVEVLRAVLIMSGIAMLGSRAGYWLFVVGLKSVVMLAVIAVAVVWYSSNAHAQTSIPICATDPSVATDHCLMTGKAGLYLLSREKGYSLNCASYDCGKMMQIYLETKRIPDPIKR